MPLPSAALEHYQAGQRLSTVAISNARRLWRQMTGDFTASWTSVRPRVAELVTSAQLAAAQEADNYVAAVLRETGQRAPRVAAVNPWNFAGIAADGRELGSMLDGAVVAARVAVGRGASVQESLGVGGRWLDMAVHTETRDADRVATQVAIAARPEVAGWVRMVNPPACSRCIILAGRWYRYDAGFDRHNRCDCQACPAAEDVPGDWLTDSSVYFRSLSPEAQNDTFTAAGAEAIRQGADINQVVNARRGLSVAGSRLTTTEGTTKRGFAGKRMAANGDTVRLMPESIFELARDRSEAIDLLTRAGFLI